MRAFRFVSWLLLLLFGSRAAPLAQAQDSPIRSGPMVGHVEMRAANLWVQIKLPVPVRFEVWQEGTPDKIIRTPEAFASPEDAFVVKQTVFPLEAGKTYLAAVLVAGRRVALPQPFRFQTPVHWQHRSDPPDFTVATGSCVYVNDTPYDRPGTPYGGGYEIFNSINAKQPQVMLWLGDNTYLREPDFSSRASVHYRWTHTRSLPEMQPLLASAANYFIWDDHDYGFNDSDRSFRDKGITRAAFELFTANPTYGLPEQARLINTSFEWGDAEFFLADDRTDRAPNKSGAANKPYLGRDQLRWLIDALTTSEAAFKFVCIGNQVLNPGVAEGIEAYAKYPEEHAELLTALKAGGIRGVIFLSGDRHHAELSRLERPGTYPLYDLTTSPLTSGVSRRGEKDKNELRVEGTFLIERNFALLRFSGPKAERVLTMQVCRTDGSVAWERKIEAKELR